MKTQTEQIFNVISTSAENLEEAKDMLMLYILDISFSRDSISHALKLLEEYYSKED